MKRVVVSAMMVNDKNRILFSRRADSGKYCPPGGKVELDETLEEGLAREIKEEVNLKVQPKDMEFVGFCDVKDKVIFFYLIFTWTGELRNNEPKKHGEWEWMPDIPSDCVEGLRYFKRVLRGDMWVRIYEQSEAKREAEARDRSRRRNIQSRIQVKEEDRRVP